MFRGEDGETHEPVVIKTIRVGLPPEKVAVVAPALAALMERLPAHPALSPVVATGVVGVEPYIVSPYIEGDSLDVALREYGPAGIADALPRLRLLADALDAAAAIGAAHGSLHLRDIVVSVDETVVTGVGIAGVLERVGVRPPVRRPYCAPELAQGHGISPAADQYALAAIAHEWLSGRRIGGPGAAGLFLPPFGSMPRETVHAVFARALAESPADRFATVTAFVDALALATGMSAPGTSGRRAPAAEARPMVGGARPPAVDTPRLAFGDDDGDGVDEVVPVPGRRSAEAAGAHVATRDVMPDAPPTVDVHAPADGNPEARLEAADYGAQVAPRVEDRDSLEMPFHRFAEEQRLDWDLPDEVPQAPARPAFHAAPDDRLSASTESEAGGEWSVDDDVAAIDDRVRVAARPTPAEEPPGRSWSTWLLGAAVLGVAALAGGWGILRWSSPSAVGVSSVAPTAPSRDASQPAETPRAAPPPAASAPTPAPAAVPAVPDRPVTAPRPPDEAPARVPAAPAPTATSSGRPAPSAPSERAAPTRPVAVPPSPPRAPAAPSTGRLLVRSTPAGADVMVNGERRGVTPLTLRALAFGTYDIRVSRAGYAPVDDSVAVDARRPARAIDLTLARLAPSRPRATETAPATPAASPAASTGPGSLLVDSRPSGARVTVDGVAVGVTPLTLPSVPLGVRAVRIERDGYLPIATTATITSGARARVAVSLTAERPR